MAGLTVLVATLGTTVGVVTAAPSPPTVRVSPPEPGSNGWYTGPVNVGADCEPTAKASGPLQLREDGVYSDWSALTCTDGATGEVATGPVGAPVVNLDTSPPPAPAIWVPAATTYEIGAQVKVSYACAPDPVSGLAACAGTYAGSGGAVPSGESLLDTGEPGNPASLGPRTIRVVATNLAGLTSTAERTYRVVDTTRPTTPVLVSPARGSATSLRSPTFVWAASTDAGSGLARYRLRVGGRDYTVQPGIGAQISVTIPDALPDGTYAWQVFAIDNAGNQSASGQRLFSVDPSTLPAPSITQGPTAGAPTNQAAPVFSVTHPAATTFRWQALDAADAVVPGGEGTGASPIQLPSLADGTYTFSVTALTAAGAESQPAAALFRVDTVAPGAPRITRSPGAAADTRPSFAWEGAEAGGGYQWQVLKAGGGTALGPGGTADTSLRLPTPLAVGSYAFRVRQVDLAGNAGPWSAPEPFTITGPAPPPSTLSRNLCVKPRVLSTARLTPRKGAVVRTTRATLRWRKAPGARQYNVQVFRVRVVAGRGTYSKVLSVFPRTTRYRVPARALSNGARYYWRVWPYTVRKGVGRFPKRPLGASYFDAGRRACVAR